MIVGYLVQNVTGDGLVEQDGVLWLGNAITLFHNYEGARQASRRTARYARKHGYSWGTGLRIRRVLSSDSGLD